MLQLIRDLRAKNETKINIYKEVCLSQACSTALTTHLMGILPSKTAQLKLRMTVWAGKDS